MKTDLRETMLRLLPAVYRLYDAKEGSPLQALLGIIGEQAQVIQDDIEQLYDNWFIETCEPWVVPYLGALVGTALNQNPGSVTTERDRERVLRLFSRQRVADALNFRRRKGTLSALEDLARGTAGWPARAVEFSRVVSAPVALNFADRDRTGTLSLGDGRGLAQLEGAFEAAGRSVDIRSAVGVADRGLPGLWNVGVFVWRLEAISATDSPAAGPVALQVGTSNKKAWGYSFDPLGRDGPLFTRSEPEARFSNLARPINVPMPIGRREFAANPALYYGQQKSFRVWIEPRNAPARPVPRRDIVAAVLGRSSSKGMVEWAFQPFVPNPETMKQHVAIDPELGRILVLDEEPADVWVSYHYGAAGQIGGGEYTRHLQQPIDSHRYRVFEQGGKKTDEFANLTEALAKWRIDAPDHAVIEICDSASYADDIMIELRAGQQLQIRAADETRPIVRAIVWQGPNGASASRLILDGLWIRGGVTVKRPQPAAKSPPKAASNVPDSPLPRLTVRHCTLLPAASPAGASGACDCSKPAVGPRLGELNLHDITLRVDIDSSILGAIVVDAKEDPGDPLPLDIADCILDPGHLHSEAISRPSKIDEPNCKAAHVQLQIARSTVLGEIFVFALERADNTLFLGRTWVKREQFGCLRYSYVGDPHAKTPRRYRCQPDLVVQTAFARIEQATTDAAATGLPPVYVATPELEAARVRPQFVSVTRGDPEYCQLDSATAPEIRRGANDESEMGVYHDLYQPQREQTLLEQLQDSVPAETDVRLIVVN